MNRDRLHISYNINGNLKTLILYDATLVNAVAIVQVWYLLRLSEASLSGRVRDGAAKQLLAKQLQGLQAGQPEFMNLSTGQIRAKKAKKEKTREEEAMFEMKKMQKKFL